MKAKKAKFNFMFLLILAILLIMIYFQVAKKEVIMQKSFAQTETIQPHIDEETGEKYITYEDFGATEKEGHDNYQVIKDTHDYANQNNIAVRATLSCYHIYKMDDINPIVIETNTNWNHAKFIIHDEEIAGKKAKDYPIFQINANEKEKTITDKEVLKNIIINKNTKNIEQLAGNGNCLCIAYNENKMQYKRSGSLQNAGKPQQDIFKIDNAGNLLNEIIWDFEEITKIVLIPIPDETLIVQNGNFQTNLPIDREEQESGYFNRNIICYRSNTILKNINHKLNDEEATGGPYYGFLRTQRASDVKITECELVAHKYEKASNYDLIIENTANTEIENVTCKNIEDSHRWGITGSNYTKDITYKNCILNRIDAHCGVHNLKIEDCQIGICGITVQGSGELNITNTTSCGRNGFVYLREDYGSSWNGNINIKDCIFKGTKFPRIIHFKISYDEDGQLHDYGYDLYLPNINIDGLTIEDTNIPAENENIYIYDNNKNFTRAENGEVRNNYILPKNITIENYQTTTGRKLKLFSNQFYDNLEELGITLSMPLADGGVEDYQIDKDTIKNISGNTKKTEFMQKLGSNEPYTIIRGEKTLLDKDTIATGDILETKTGKKYTLIVTGDITKDGQVNIKDIVKLRRYLILKNNLDAIELLSADTNLDDKDITIKDLVRMRKIVLEKQ